MFTVFGKLRVKKHLLRNVGIFMMYRQAKFHVRSCNGSLNNAIKIP
jgi:hypothetical protein